MDRQDIDALLIGALYGELTPADEARLAAHLDSHPADRGALDDFKNVRQAVRESRIFELQLDPPQAVSALLLQEAHRRAPKRVVRDEEKEGWFARFARAFMAHPAMAAAAMLVLVVGVASMIYVKKGDHFAGKEVSAPALPQAETATAEPGPTTAAVPEPAAGSAYQVGLAENANELAKQGDDKAVRGAKDVAAAEPQKQQKLERERKQATHGIAVTTKGGTPKELGGKSDAYGYADEGRAAGGAAAPSAQPAQVATAPAKKAEAPPPPAATVDTTASMDPALLAWAKQQHQAAIKAAQAGNCGRAATLAIEIGNKAPDYYAQKMATDRNLKSCQQYIVDKRNEEAEQKQKSRASKRVNADEPYEAAPPAPSK